MRRIISCASVAFLALILTAPVYGQAGGQKGGFRPGPQNRGGFQQGMTGQMGMGMCQGMGMGQTPSSQGFGVTNSARTIAMSNPYIQGNGLTNPFLQNSAMVNPTTQANAMMNSYAQGAYATQNAILWNQYMQQQYMQAYMRSIGFTNPQDDAQSGN